LNRIALLQPAKRPYGVIGLGSPPCVVAQDGNSIPVFRLADFTAREPSGENLLRGRRFGRQSLASRSITDHEYNQR
jgi:hypothetical protein